MAVQQLHEEGLQWQNLIISQQYTPRTSDKHLKGFTDAKDDVVGGRMTLACDPPCGGAL